jgi:aldose 1-epimerase
MTATTTTAADTRAFELHAGALRLAVRPDLGGSIAGFWHRDTPIMRSTEPTSLQSARLSASFPLVPYSNRLAYCKFRWKGREYTTQRNFGDSPHSVHGMGWMRPWEVGAHSAIDVELRLDHAGDEHWPFAFEAVQHFSLTPQSLVAQMIITNTADIAQPVGLGWHPYFPKRARSRLHVELSDRWDPDPQQLPVRKVTQPGIDGDIAHMEFDNGFEGWRGPARIRDEKFSLQMTSNLPYLVVYTPRDKDYFCVEPVSHVGNAIHMADPAAHGLRTLQPGESFEATMTIEVAVL